MNANSGAATTGFTTYSGPIYRQLVASRKSTGVGAQETLVSDSSPPKVLIAACSDDRFRRPVNVITSRLLQKYGLQSGDGVPKFCAIHRPGGGVLVEHSGDAILPEIALLLANGATTVYNFAHEDCKYMCQAYPGLKGEDLTRVTIQDLQKANMVLRARFPGVACYGYFLWVGHDFKIQFSDVEKIKV